jgi:predicted nucleic acid-binding Zn ribbon protein
VYSYVIKDYGEPVNYQRVAIDAADPRIFRFEDFRKSGALGRGMLDFDYGQGYGRSLDENNSDLVLNEYKHWLNKEIKKGGKKIFNKNLNLHLMGTIDKSNDSHDVQMQRVTAKFKEMLDRVATEFSGSEQAIKDAIERDSGVMSKAEIIRNFERNLKKTEPRQPTDRDLQLPDNEFRQKLTNYLNNVTKFNQIRATL